MRRTTVFVPLTVIVLGLALPTLVAHLRAPKATAAPAVHPADTRGPAPALAGNGHRPSIASPVAFSRRQRRARRAAIAQAAADLGPTPHRRDVLALVRACFPALAPAPPRPGAGEVAGLALDPMPFPLQVTPPARPRGVLTLRTRGLTFRVRRLDAAWPSRPAAVARFGTPGHLLAPAGAFGRWAHGWVAERVDEYRILRRQRAWAGTYEMTLPRGVTRVHDAGGFLELYGRGGYPVLRFYAAVAVGAGGHRRTGHLVVAGLRRGGWRAVSGPLRVRTSVEAAGLQAPVVVDPGWAATGAMITPGLEFHTATRLASGKVLVAGGDESLTATAACELYDPASRSWAATGSLHAPRDRQTATLLPNGDVLVTSGFDSNLRPLATAEVYDHVSGTWSTVGPMSQVRGMATATLLQNGEVLIAGGGTTSAELYQPGSRTFTATGSLHAARNAHIAVLLGSGKVLVAGGSVGTLPSATAEIYDPGTGTWATTASMTEKRVEPRAVLLHNGWVLVVGGETQGGGQTPTAEVFNPSTGTWTPTGSTSTPRLGLAMSLLRDGRVMITGGNAPTGQNNALPRSTEIYTPTLGTWAPGRQLIDGHSYHTSTVLQSGEVLVAGGSYGSTSAELYVETPPVAQDQTVKVQANQSVVITLAATDAENDPLTYRVVQSVSHGILTGTVPSLTYAPASDYHGPDGFTFVANDGVKDSAPATVSIDVQDTAPVVQGTSASTHMGTAVSIPVQATDAEHDPLTYRVSTPPAHGQAVAKAAGTFTYTPTADYVGSDTFEVIANDGTLDSQAAKVIVDVTDTAPVAKDATVRAQADTDAQVTLSATDPDGDPLTYAVAAPPAHGTITGTPPTLVYQPASGFSGTDALLFTASDGALLASGKVTIEVAKAATGGGTGPSGCGCSATGGSPAGLAALLLVLAALWPRRRRA